jgi:hypothetical protein
MRYVTLMVLMSGAVMAQSRDWRPPNLPRYFQQFKLPLRNPSAKIELAPGQKCAIPLTNALKKDTTNDRMVFHPAPATKSPAAGIVTPPAPSCDDVR